MSEGERKPEPTVNGGTEEDRQAFDQLVSPYRSLVMRYCSTVIGGNTTALEDIVQETFIRAWIHRGTYNEGRPIDRWLIGIARHRCFDFLVSNKSNRTSLPELDEVRATANIGQACATASGADPELYAISSETTQNVLDAIEQLPERYRFALTKNAFDELSYAEIAKALSESGQKVTENNVGVIISRARAKLKVALKPYLDS